MFSFLLSAVGVPNISNLSASTTTNNKTKKRNNNKAKKARKKNSNSISNNNISKPVVKNNSVTIMKPNHLDDDDEEDEEEDDEESTVKSEVAEESLKEEEESEEEDEEEESDEGNPIPITQEREDAILSGGPIEALMKEVSVRCGVEVSVVFGCMNQLWENNLQYDNADVLARAVEEFKKIYTPKGTHKRAPFSEEPAPSAAPSSSSSNALPTPADSAAPSSSSAAASTRPAGSPLSIAERLELAAQHSSRSVVESLTALGSWAKVFNQTHRSKSPSTTTTTTSGGSASEAFFSSKALAILLTTILGNLTLLKDLKVRSLFAELIANLAEISSQHAAVTAVLGSLDTLAQQVDALTSEAAALVRATDSSGVCLLAESVSVCVRRALDVALTSAPPALTAPQRVEREERRLREMLDGKTLLAALGQVDALLTSLDSKDKQLGQGDKSTVQRLFQRRETRLDKLQLLLENVEGIRSVSSQVLLEVRSAQLGQPAPVQHSVDLTSIKRLLAQEAVSLEARLLADSGLTGESLEVKQQAALNSQSRIHTLQSEHDGQVRQLQEQLSASTVKVSNLIAQRDQLRQQLAAVEKDIQLAQESQEKGRADLTQAEARFRNQMEQLAQSNQSAAQSVKGHGGLGGILSSVAAFEQALLQPFLQPPQSATLTSAPLPPALVQSATLTASSGGPVLAARQRLAEDAFCEYLSAEGDCLRLLMERGRSAQDRLTQLVKEQQAFQDLAMTKLSSDTTSKIAKLSQEMAEDVLSMRQLLDGVALALTRVQANIDDNASSSSLGPKAADRLSSVLRSLKEEQASSSLVWPEELLQWWERHSARGSGKKPAAAAAAAGSNPNPNTNSLSSPGPDPDTKSTALAQSRSLSELSGSGTVASSTREFSLQALLDAAAGGAGNSSASSAATLTPSKPTPKPADGNRKQQQSRPTLPATQTQGQRQPNPNTKVNSRGQQQVKSTPPTGGTLRKAASTSSVPDAAGSGQRRDTSAAIHLLEKMVGANSKAAVPRPAPAAPGPGPVAQIPLPAAASTSPAPSSDEGEPVPVAVADDEKAEQPSEPSAADQEGEIPTDTTPDPDLTIQDNQNQNQGEEEEKERSAEQVEVEEEVGGGGGPGPAPVEESAVPDPADLAAAPMLSQVGRTTRRKRRGGKRVKARRLRREGLGQGDAHQDAEEEGDDDDVDVDVDVKTVDEGEKEKKAEVVDLPSSVMSREQGGADLPSSAVVSEQGDANLPSSPGRKSQEVGFDDLTFCGEETVVIFDQSQPNLGKLLSPCSPRSPRMTDSSPDNSPDNTIASRDEPEEDVQTDFESRSDSATKLKSQQRDVALTLALALTSANTTPVKEPQGGTTFQSPFVDMGEVYPNEDDLVGDAEGHPNLTAHSSSKGEGGSFSFESNPSLSIVAKNPPTNSSCAIPSQQLSKESLEETKQLDPTS